MSAENELEMPDFSPVTPIYPGVDIDNTPRGIRAIMPVSTSITAFVGSAPRGMVNKPVPVRTYEDYERLFGGLAASSAMSYAVTHFFQNGGSDALIIRVVDLDIIGNPEDGTGIFALEQSDLFNILCLPRFVSEGDISASSYATALSYCVSRRAMLLIDPPSQWGTVDEAVSGIANFTSSFGGETQIRNAALYFPRINVPDPLHQDSPIAFVPCGAVAGIIASTDAVHGVWKSSAGTFAKLNGVQDLTVKLTDQENGRLGSLGINCLRSFDRFGNVVWGDRTLAGNDALASEWKYVPVRRLALFLEESLYRGTQWAVFEPNGEPLWAQIRLNVSAFMQDLFQKGALQGQTPQEAYFVRCDSGTTTQSDIDAGIVNIVVGFAPLKPAEFVVIQIQQLAGNH
jgi:phage tail sheath protein FI